MATSVCANDRCGAEFTRRSGNQKFCPACSPKIVARQRKEARVRYYLKNKQQPPQDLRRCDRCFKQFVRTETRQEKCPACVRLDSVKHNNFGPVLSHPRDQWLYIGRVDAEATHG